MPRKPSKGDGPGKPGPLRKWESRYPDLPDLTQVAALREYESLISRVEEGGASEEDHELFDAAFLLRVIRRLHSGEALVARDAADLADRLYGVLAGMAWEDAFSLPGREMPIEWHALAPKDQRDLQLYADAENLISAGEKVTTAIGIAAERGSVSFETARAAYYSWRNRRRREGF